MVVSIILMFREGTVNDIIVTAWFTLWAVELYALASIKKSERIKQNDNEREIDGDSEESD